MRVDISIDFDGASVDRGYRADLSNSAIRPREQFQVRDIIILL